MKQWCWAVILGASLFACEGENGREDLAHLPYDPHPVMLTEPVYVVKMAIPADNPLTTEGIELGRRLFFDPLLSIDGTVACATCHHTGRAFTDGLPLSKGVEGRKGKRSAPSLINVGYYSTGLFWDGRVATLEEQALHPIEDSLEMACSWDTVAARLRRHPNYPALFRSAFGIDDRNEINRERTAQALAQFQRSLISFESRFDSVQRGETAFTSSEKRGWTIFFDASPGVPASECNHCHVDPLFTSQEYFNNGLDDPAERLAFSDQGRGAVTGRVYDKGKFRAPTLRNIELTAPYMHDGRFATLEEVIDHYNEGGHFAENLSPNVRKLGLTEQDKQDLLAFLRTLTDVSMTQNPDFQDPFLP